MDSFYADLMESVRNTKVLPVKILDFNQYIIKNEVVSDRWRCIDKRDDDPAPWNHSQDTPLRNFYHKNLKVKDTKNEQRKMIMENYQNEAINVINLFEDVSIPFSFDVLIKLFISFLT